MASKRVTPFDHPPVLHRPEQGHTGLTKELFSVLPDGEDRKLVAFTDSREDAATLANGVEREHFLDLLREAAFDELALASLDQAAFVEDWERVVGRIQRCAPIRRAESRSGGATPQTYRDPSNTTP